MVTAAIRNESDSDWAFQGSTTANNGPCSACNCLPYATGCSAGICEYIDEEEKWVISTPFNGFRLTGSCDPTWNIGQPEPSCGSPEDCGYKRKAYKCR